VKQPQTINPHPHSLREHLLFALHGRRKAPSGRTVPANPLLVVRDAPPEMREQLSAMVSQALAAREAGKRRVEAYRREMRERQTSLLDALEATLR